MPEGFSTLRNRTSRPHVILNWFQDLLIITNKEILNSHNSREPQRLMFQNDMRKIPLPFPPLKKGAKPLLHFLSCPPPHPNPLP